MLLTPKQIDQHIATKLKTIRFICGISQEELGSLLGITSQQIQKYESARNRISASRLFEISQILNKPIGIFFEGLIADCDYYNYNFLSQENQVERAAKDSKDLLSLVRAFLKIKNSQLRKDLLKLVNSMAVNDDAKKSWYF